MLHKDKSEQKQANKEANKRYHTRKQGITPAERFMRLARPAGWMDKIMRFSPKS